MKQKLSLWSQKTIKYQIMLQLLVSKRWIFTREGSYCFQPVLAVAIQSICPSVRLPVTRVDQSKAVQARITKSSPSAARKTLFFSYRKTFP